MKKAFLNWSSGKDAAFALYLLQQEKEYSVEKLVTTVDSQYDRVSMHGLRNRLLRAQTRQLNIPLHPISLDSKSGLEEYNRRMAQEMAALRAEGFTHGIFGDIFLEDLKEYRQQQLQKVDLEAVFPLWKMNTWELIRSFLEAGFKAITVSVNSKVLDKSFCGRIIDKHFIADLPAGVDPCGENGEFHTFVFDGPVFKNPVSFQKGEISEEIFSAGKGDSRWDTRFWNIDLLSE